MDDILKLPEVMDASGARQVLDELLGRRGQPLCIDASSVQKVSALALEVLVSATRQWREDTQSVSITGMSDAFRTTCDGLGLEGAVFDAANGTMPVPTCVKEDAQ